MSYKEFFDTLLDEDKIYYDIVFGCSHLDELIFEKCYAVAEEIVYSKLGSADVAVILSNLPADYAEAILVLVEKLDPTLIDEMNKVDTFLTLIYYRDFKQAYEQGKINNLFITRKKETKRPFDMTEKIMIAEYLGLKGLDLVNYQGNDKLALALKDTYKLYSKNFNNYQEYLAENYTQMFDEVLNKISSFNYNV